MKRLKELREKTGLSTRELAEELGIKSHSLITRYELGHTAGVKYDFIIKVCDYFNVTPNYLLGYEDDCQNLENEELEKSGNSKVEELQAENKLLKEALLRLAILLQ